MLHIYTMLKFALIFEFGPIKWLQPSTSMIYSRFRITSSRDDNIGCFHAIRDAQPVKAGKSVGDVVRGSHTIDQPCCRIQCRL